MDDIQKQVNKLIAECDKEFGAGSCMRLDYVSDEIPSVSSGILPLDEITGIGGYPSGKIIEVYGPPSCGKTTTTLHVCKQAQKQSELPVLYLDYEHALDKKYAAKIGVDLNNFILSQPETFEQGMSIAEKFMVNNLVSCVVADSVASMLPKVELEDLRDPKTGRLIGNARPMIQAVVMATALRQLTHRISKSKAPFIFINQIRQKVNMDGPPATRNIKKTGTPGGDSLKFYAAMRIEFKAIKGVKGVIIDPVTTEEQEMVVASVIQAQVVKNKCAVPFRTGEFVIRYGIGVDHVLTLINIAIKRNVIRKKGGWFYIPPQVTAVVGSAEEKPLNGVNSVWEFLCENSEAYFKLKEIIIDLIKGSEDEEGADTIAETKLNDASSLDVDNVPKPAEPIVTEQEVVGNELES